MGAPGEAWPVRRPDPRRLALGFDCDRSAMRLVLQLNLRQAPLGVLPDGLADLALICVYAAAPLGPEHLLVRAYPSLDGLAPLSAPADAAATARGRGRALAWRPKTDHGRRDEAALWEAETRADPAARRARPSRRAHSQIGGYAFGAHAPAGPARGSLLREDERPGRTPFALRVAAEHLDLVGPVPEDGRRDLLIAPLRRRPSRPEHWWMEFTAPRPCRAGRITQAVSAASASAA